MTRVMGRPVILVAHPSAELYGSDRVLIDTVRALADGGYDVIVTVPVDGPLLPLLRDVGARVVFCPTPVLRKSALRPAGLVRLLSDVVRGLARGGAILVRERPSAVWVNTVTIPLWLLMAKAVRVGTICHVHEGESSASRALRLAITLPLHFADRIVANSKFSTDVLRASSERIGRRVEVVYNGVPGPTRRSKARAVLDGPVRLVYVGRLSPRKGVDVAVSALAILRDQGVPARLDLVGAVFPGYEWYERQLGEQVSRAGLVDAVRFHGFLSNIWDFMESGDVVVVPSRRDEPFGNTAVEAVLGGRPVIASATSGLLEATSGYACAKLVPPDDPDALAAAVKEVVSLWPGLRDAAWSDIALAEAKHSPAVYRNAIADVVNSLRGQDEFHAGPAQGHGRRTDVPATS
jgi:glycosyltransferase involved in cell wall biosynthesis